MLVNQKLVQIIVGYQLGNKPLPELMSTYCQVNRLQLIFWWTYNNFLSFENICKNGYFVQ